MALIDNNNHSGSAGGVAAGLWLEQPVHNAGVLINKMSGQAVVQLNLVCVWLVV